MRVPDSLLITGGTGSFGSAFTRYALDKGVGRIVIYSRDELKQSQMRAALEGYTGRLLFVLGDVRDRTRLRRAMDGMEWVVHAAALKQVPTLEHNPYEAIQTNILGTLNVAEAALDAGVERLVGISSDKAVAPYNLYGATKMVMERVLVQFNACSRQSLSACVRYGNVFGSRGSVVDVWRQPGVLPIVDPEATRFLLSLREGCALVWLALQTMWGGEIFVPHPPSVSIGVLAATLYPGRAWARVGVRPGEKKHELLISPEEAAQTRRAGDGYVIVPTTREWLWGKGGPLGAQVSEGFSLCSADNPMNKGALAAWLGVRYPGWAAGDYSEQKEGGDVSANQGGIQPNRELAADPLRAAAEGAGAGRGGLAAGCREACSSSTPQTLGFSPGEEYRTTDLMARLAAIARSKGRA